MKKIVSRESLAYLGHLRHLLEEAGIATHIRNEGLAGALGEIPFLECWPELMVVNDDDEARAKRLIAEYEAPADPGAAWVCAACGEENEGQFGRCWRCGNEAP